MKELVKKALPGFILSAYHFALAFLGALIYRFPSRKLTVIGVTGTKGKTTTAELLNAVLEAAGKKTAVLGTLRFKVGENSRRNLRKMTMPGRFFVQKFLRDAVSAGCTHAIIEMTSEGAAQFRQRFVAMDALIFTNLAPEHIESHGSYEKYRDAKLAIAKTLSRSSKPKRFMVANADDKVGAVFLQTPNTVALPYLLYDAHELTVDERGGSFEWSGVRIMSLLPGKFNVYNILAAATCARALGISSETIASGVAQTQHVEGRMEKINAGQNFPVVVDYAHTPDSLDAVYATYPDHEKICVLGNTGGGRDKWKRSVMGEIADNHCAHIILTNEDPYDENPWEILLEVRKGITSQTPVELILDRRIAVARALSIAATKKHPAVLITGKGTDPFIMGPNGSKEPWDDRQVAREEIVKLLDAQSK